MLEFPGINLDLAWRFYLWLCHREGIWRFKHGYCPRWEATEDGDMVLTEEIDSPPHWLYTRMKHLMYFLGFIPF
jgi:hypothetical protein